jgi:glycosyltransferase involved in cell wall biosynthesis
MGVYNQWNTAALERAVSSVLSQSLGDFEFIIWDDGSEGEAALALRKLPEKDSRIILAGRDENKGLAFSLNECIKLAKGKYIARMDADDECLPDRFARQVEFLENNPEYAWCGTGAELFDENGAWGYRQMPEVPEKKDYYRYSPYIHPSVMFRRSVFDSFAGYLEEDETYRCEDYEIFMRLMQKGLKGYNLPEPLFRYFECNASYRSRNVKNRINEARVRAAGYKKMGIMFPFGWIYVLRPIVACIVPSVFIARVKRCEGKRA